MRNLLKFAFLSFAVCALWSFGLSNVSAQCDCVKPNITAIEEYANSSVVFTGEVIDIRKSERDKTDQYYETVRIAVDRAWKQDLSSFVTIKNRVFGCTQGWQKGDKYLVYGYLNDDKATYSTRCCCSRTGELEKIESDVTEFLKAGYQQSKVTAAKERVISAGWMNSRALNFINPEYPKTTSKNPIAARVEVKILTDVEGTVISVEIIRGPEEFHVAAIAAASKLRFPPTTLSEVPAKVSGWVSYDFKP